MLWELAQNCKDNSDRINSLRNDDGLVSTSEIDFVQGGSGQVLRLRRFPEVQVFPHIQVLEVVRLLHNDKSLWANAAIDVAAMPSIIGRVTIFGVSLPRAFDEATKRGLQKSRFALPPGSYDSQRGFPADLLLFVGTDSKEGADIRELQVWEEVRGSSEVFYGHAIVSVVSQTVRHLDCATIHLSDQQKEHLFGHAQKIKGDSYKKHFRVDGQFQLTTAIDLMRAYFPVEELLNEAFEIS